MRSEPARRAIRIAIDGSIDYSEIRTSPKSHPDCDQLDRLITTRSELPQRAIQIAIDRSIDYNKIGTSPKSHPDCDRSIDQLQRDRNKPKEPSKLRSIDRFITVRSELAQRSIQIAIDRSIDRLQQDWNQPEEPYRSRSIDRSIDRR
jgi:hypothetical protein